MLTNDCTREISELPNPLCLSYKINASYKTLAAIPTNTLLLEQKVSWMLK
ncbi:hypothetical protein Chor_006912, partial [Crotalus horridus]